jgi:hypothetical protein
MDAHGHVQVPLAVLMVFSVALGVVWVTDFRGIASRWLDHLRQERVMGRLYARMPVSAFRAFGVWPILFGVGQFFLFRYVGLASR